MYDPRINLIRAAINADLIAVEAAIDAEPAPSGWLGPLRDAVDAHRKILDLAEDYSPELSDGDNGEWAFGEVLGLLADLYRLRPESERP